MHALGRWCVLACALSWLVREAHAAPPTVILSPVSDAQPSGRAVPIGARVEGDVGRVLLRYRAEGAATFTDVEMAAVGEGYFAARVAAPDVRAPGVAYYVYAESGGVPAETATAPPEGPSAPFTFAVELEDGAAPQLLHTPVALRQAPGLTVPIVAFADDASAVAEVALHHRGPSFPFSRAVLRQVGGGVFVGEIPASSVLPPYAEYYLEAQDARLMPNVARFPTGGATTPATFPVNDPGAPDVEHTPVTGPFPALEGVPMEARVSDDGDLASVSVFFRVEGAGQFATAPLERSGNRYAGEIPPGSVLAPRVEYYVEATDADGFFTRAPFDAPRSLFRFGVTPGDPGDITGPTILHDPVPDDRPWRDPVRVEAEVDDPSGVFTVRLNVTSVGTASVAVVVMTREEGNRFAAEIPGLWVRGATVAYDIVALDASTNGNLASSPEGAPVSRHVFTVLGDPNVGWEDPYDPFPPGNGCGCAAARPAGRAPVVGWLLLILLGLRRRGGSRSAACRPAPRS